MTARYLDTDPLGMRRPAVAGRLDWLRRWWPLLLLTLAYLTLVAYVLSHDDPRQPGLSDREAIALAAGAIVVLILGRRRRAWGGREVARTLAEYALVALLVGALVTLQPVTPVKHRARSAGGPHVTATTRPPRAPATTRPPLVALVPDPGADRAPSLVDRAAGAIGWLVGLWRQADEQTEPAPTTTTTPPHRPRR
jgi:hypothetical protein